MVIPAYCLNFENPENGERMTRIFNQLGIPLTLYPGVPASDPRMIEGCHLKPTSIMLGHLDLIEMFLKTDAPYGLFMEDDLMVHSQLNNFLPGILQQIQDQGIQCLLLGYMMPFHLQVGDRQGYSFVDYPDESNRSQPLSIWGAQLYILERSYAKKVIEKYGDGSYLKESLKDPSLLPFASDWTITKEASRRAFIYPPLAMENWENRSILNEGNQAQQMTYKIYGTPEFLK